MQLCVEEFDRCEEAATQINVPSHCERLRASCTAINIVEELRIIMCHAKGLCNALSGRMQDACQDAGD